MFTLSTGSYAALEKALLADLQDARKASPLDPLLVVSPSARLLDRLQRRLAAQGAFLNIHFLTFYALAEQLLKDRPNPGQDRIVKDPVLFHEALRLLFQTPGVLSEKTVSAFHVRGGIAKGLPSALAETLRDLRDSGMRYKDAAEAALEGHLGPEGARAAPLLELNAVLTHFLIQKGLRTRADQIRRAAEATAQGHSWIQAQKTIFLYGFYDLTGVQLDLVQALAGHPDARVYFPYEEGDSVYAFTDKTLQDISVKASERTVLPSPAPAATQVELWTTSGTQDEVWLAAKKILQTNAAGIPFSEMALVVRSLPPYASLIECLFKTHAIPYLMTSPQACGAYPLVKAIRQLLALAQRDFPFGDVFDVFESPYLADQAGSRAAIADAKALARFAGIARGWERWENRLLYWNTHRLPGSFAERLDAQAGGRFLQILARLHEALQRNTEGTSPWTLHTDWALEVLQAWIALPIPAEKEELALWDAVREKITSLATLDALGSPVSRAHFLDTLADALDHLTLTLTPVDNAGVRVLDIMAARGQRYKAAFVLGLNEKSFPRVIREDPFLPDAQRGVLANVTGARLARKLDGYAEERLLFHFVTQVGEEKLHLSAQRSDEEGEDLVLSLYLQEWASKRGLKFNRLPRSPAEKLEPVDPLRWTPKELSITLNRRREETAPFYKALGWDHTLFQHLLIAQQDLDRLEPLNGARDGYVGPSRSGDALLTQGLSPHSLQELSQCPFRYFVRKLLALDPLERPRESGELESDEEGKLLHAVLEHFYNGLHERPQPFGEREIKERLDKACEKALGGFRHTTFNLYPIAWKAFEARARRILFAFLTQDIAELSYSGFWPRSQEAELSAPIRIKDVNMLFHGRADRIDVRQDGSFRVIDYKTGKPGKAETLDTTLLRGKHLQLPIYLALASSFLKKEGDAAPVGESASLYEIRTGLCGTDAPGIGLDFWQRLGGPMQEGWAELIARVRHGAFYIRPTDTHGHCSWCDYATLCRKAHPPSVRRNEAYAARQKHEELMKRTAKDFAIPVEKPQAKKKVRS